MSSCGSCEARSDSIAVQDLRTVIPGTLEEEEEEEEEEEGGGGDARLLSHSCTRQRRV